jgi:hypothetical protein
MLTRKRQSMNILVAVIAVASYVPHIAGIVVALNHMKCTLTLCHSAETLTTRSIYRVESDYYQRSTPRAEHVHCDKG